MPDVIESLESQPDASTSPDPEVRYADDKSVDTGVEAPTETVEVEAETEEVVDKPESEAAPSTAEEEDLEEKTDSSPDDDPEYGAKVKERIDTLTTNWRDTERLVEARNVEIAELRQKLSEVPVQQEPLKTQADFDFDDAKYQEYLMDEGVKRSTAAAELAVSTAQDKKAFEERQAKVAEAESKYAEKHKDYFTVTRDPNLRISTPMLDAAAESDIREDVLYHLAKNPDKALKIHAMSAAASGFQVGLLSAELKSEQVKAAKPKVVSDAPPPVPKIKTGDAGLDKGYVSTMTDSQFAKRRAKEIANR